MGTDKALLPVIEGGPPMLALVLERLKQVADDVTIVDNDPHRYEDFGVRIVPDLYADIGALGGIHAAITHAAHEHCVVVGCDMPFLNPALLKRMATESREYDVLVPVVPGESRQGRDGQVRQTLHAIFSKRCLPAIESRIERGERQVIGFFADVRVRELPQAEIRSLDPELASFFNANTPEALAWANTLAEGRERFAGQPRSYRERVVEDDAAANPGVAFDG